MPDDDDEEAVRAGMPTLSDHTILNSDYDWLSPLTTVVKMYHWRTAISSLVSEYVRLVVWVPISFVFCTRAF